MASTFANNTTSWTVRADGSANNGGGCDLLYPGFGFDYTDSASPIASGTTGTCTAASTTFIDSSASFPSDITGNVLQILSATGGSAAAVDYYVATYVNSTTLTLDRSPATGTNITACTWAVGGAFLTPSNLALTATGTLPAPVTPAPLVIGNNIFLRGSGSLDPSTNDYDWSGGTWTFVGNNPIIVNGICTNIITLIGYNGRPRIAHCGNTINAGAGGGSPTSAGWDAKHLSFFRKLGTNNTPAIAYTGNNQTTPMRVTDCIFDQNGFDSPEYWGIGGGFDFNEVRNTGGGSAGTTVVVGINHPGCSCIGNYIHGVRGPAVAIATSASFTSTTHPVIAFNTITNNLNDGIQVILQNATTLYNAVIVHNTIDNNGGHGINLGTTAMSYLSCFNNTITNHTGSGKFAINFADPYQVNVQLQKNPFDANCFYGNTNNFNTISSVVAWALQANDVTANPGYVNAGAGNYATGANVHGKGLSGLGGVGGTIGAATQLLNIGAFQGLTPVTGTIASTEANDVNAISGAVVDSGSIIVTEANDANSASGTLTTSGTIASTEANDVNAASGTMSITGSMAWTEASDVNTASGVASNNATIAITEQSDTNTATATLSVSGTSATTEADDINAASGSVSSVAITGTIASTEANDVNAASGSEIIMGGIEWAEANDVMHASGSGGAPFITGILPTFRIGHYNNPVTAHVLPTLQKTPYDSGHYNIDLTAVLLPAGTQVSSVVLLDADQGALTIGSPILNPAKTIVQVQISGGEIPDTEQELSCKISLEFTTTNVPDQFRVTMLLVLQYDL